MALVHSLLQGRRCAPGRSCRQGRAWLCRALGAGSDGDVERCVPLLPLRPVVQAECPPLLSLFLSGSSSRSALTGNGSNCTCHADTTGLKQGTLGRDARDCSDPQSSVTARALGWTDWPPRSTAAAVRETESGLEMRACARCERPARTGGAAMRVVHEHPGGTE